MRTWSGWVADYGRRFLLWGSSEGGGAGEPGVQSRAALLEELEKLTHHSFRTRDDVRNFVAAVEAEKAAKHTRAADRWRVVKHSALLALLVLAVVQYYLLDTLVQIMSMRELTIFVPVKARDLRSLVELLTRLC